MLYVWGYEEFPIPPAAPTTVSFVKIVAMSVCHGLLFCRKVMSLTKIGEPSSKGNLPRNKDKDKKKRKAEESASVENKQKTVKRVM